MRFQSLLLLAVVVPAAVACGGGKNGDNSDAAVIDAPSGPVPDADPKAPDAAVPAACTPVSGTNVATVNAGSITQDSAPLLVTAPKDDPRLFVVTQDGKIRIIKNGKVLDKPFLDITNVVQDGGSEQGLLGLAFHPDYARNRKFYVFYTADKVQEQSERFSDVVAEYFASATDPDQADKTIPGSGRLLLSIPDPEDNHNGGMIEFGPDGLLWISVGDGGVQDDGQRNAQNDAKLLGKILRMDVNASKPDAKIWAKGLRNPWRWSFDSMTKELYIGDVGQGKWEEIDIAPSSLASANFQWSRFEGLELDHDDITLPAGTISPVVVHSHVPEGWNAIIGGQVYRGSCYPDLVGAYFYSDHGSKKLRSFRWVNGQVTDKKEILTFPKGPTSIHADASGELYATLDNGAILHIVAKP